MLYRNLLKIKKNDVVLEIGPGSKPYWRANILADKFDDSDAITPGNFGGGKFKTNNKPFFKIQNNILPFKDNAIDYTICSHVLEHVPYEDIQTLLDEIFRVSPKAYIEFPAPLYDIIYNFEAHLNFLDIDDNIIYCLPKSYLSSLNKIFGVYTKFLRKSYSYNGGRGYKHLFSVGKEFNQSDCHLKVIRDEKDFFQIIMNKKYYCKPPSYFWKVSEIVRKNLYKYYSKSIDLQKILLS